MTDEDFSKLIPRLESDLMSLVKEIHELNAKKIKAEQYDLMGTKKDAKAFDPKCIELSLKIVQEALVLSQDLILFKKGCL